jgi:hypothetical protein
MRRDGLIVRTMSIAIGVALALWAWSDNHIIGGGAGFGLTQRIVFVLGLIMVLNSVLPLTTAKNILMIFVSAAFAIVLAEITVSNLYGPRYRGNYQFDDEYLFELIPNTETEYAHLPINGGARIKSSVNLHGYRGNELRADDAELRIVVYGDSFIYSEFSELKNTFTEQLEEQLSEKTGRDVEVINAGIAGFGPDQILLKMSRELDQLNPDLVIVSIFSGNDFGDLVRNKLFRLQNDESITINNFAISAELVETIQLSLKEPIIKKIIRERYHDFSKSGKSYKIALEEDLFRKVELQLDQQLGEYEEFVVRGDNIVRELGSDPYSADISLLPDSDSARYKIRMMSAVIAEINKLVTAKGYPLASIIIPHPMDLLDGEHDSGAVNKENYPKYDASRLASILDSLLYQQNIPTVNLFKPFRANNPEHLYFKGGDDHWNDAGQKVAAGLVSKYLIDTVLSESQ